MRKAPIWANAVNDIDLKDSKNDFKKRGLISSDKFRKTIRHKDYI